MIYLIVGLICLALCLLVLTFAPEHQSGAFIAFLMCIAVLMIGVNVKPQGKILLSSTSKELDTMADQLTEETESLEKEDKETRKSQERRLKELADSGKATIFIDGKPTGDNFDPGGIRLDKYEIKFKNDKVYLISY